VHVYRPTCRRLPVFLDQPPTTGFNSFPYSSTLRGCPIKLDRVSPRGLLCSTAYQLTLMAALKSRFTNSMRFLLPPSLVLTSVNHPRSRGVSATPVSSSPSRRANTFTGLSPYFVFATCSFPLDGRRKGEFFVSFPGAGDDGPSGSPAFISIPFPWGFISSNERTSNASAINRE